MNVTVLLGMIGPWQIVIIIAVLVLLFGAKKIPEIARGMGKGIREFKDATKEIKNEINEAAKDDTNS